jgi:myo-inositol 2-dehydrogenase/D-chiro-inositol 1-dehydrogenase
MKSRLRFGLIGAGRIGPVHAETPAFRVPLAQLVAVADLNPSGAHAVASRCNIPRILSSGADIIADPEVDAVAICSPTDTHAELIVAAAKAGKHIFCEKPISLSLKEIDRSLAAVESAGVVVGTKPGAKPTSRYRQPMMGSGSQSVWIRFSPEWL